MSIKLHHRKEIEIDNENENEDDVDGEPDRTISLVKRLSTDGFYQSEEMDFVRTCEEGIDKDKKKISLETVSILFTAFFVGKIGRSIISTFVAITPIAMIVIGASNLELCPVCPFIPIYLLIAGLLAITDHLIRFYLFCNRNKDDKTTHQTPWMLRGLDIVLILWCVIGSYWVFKYYEPSYVPESIEYCDKVTYCFVFWTVTLGYIFLLIIPGICIGCHFLFMYYIKQRNLKDTPNV